MRVTKPHPHKQCFEGFTLIEMMVVMVIVSLLAGAVVLSINAISDRSLRNQSARLISWLEKVQEASILSGLNYGVARKDNELMVVTPFAGNWYQDLDLSKWQIDEQIELSEGSLYGTQQVNAEQVLNEEGTGNSTLGYRPFIVFSPLGNISPKSHLVLQSGEDQLLVEWLDGRNLRLDL